MRERALLVGGDLEIESRPGHGTTVRLSVPDRTQPDLRDGRLIPMKIVIADDHGIVRSGIKLLLDRQPDLEVVAEADDGIEARDLVIARSRTSRSST